MSLPEYAAKLPLLKPAVAITGGIGEGKSTALKILASQGYRTVDADRVAKSVLASGEVQQKVASALTLPIGYSPEAVKEALRRDPSQVHKLNDIVHPLVWEELQRTQAQFYEIPLLFEMNLESAFTESWLIWCPDEVKHSRLVERSSDSHWKVLESLQLPREVKKNRATRHFRSDVPLLEEEADLIIAARQVFGSVK